MGEALFGNVNVFNLYNFLHEVNSKYICRKKGGPSGFSFTECTSVSLPSPHFYKWSGYNVWGGGKGVKFAEYCHDDHYN